jgi:hypothetical protein
VNYVSNTDKYTFPPEPEQAEDLLDNVLRTTYYMQTSRVLLEL